MNRRIWDSPEKITQAYYELKQEIQRTPTMKDFKEKYSGAIAAIRKNRFVEGVTTWNGFLRYLGEEVNHDVGKWNSKEKIIGAYNSYRQELGRVPKCDEFENKYGGAFIAIVHGKMIPGVRSWNGFLRYMGEEINQDAEKWSTLDKITSVYKELKQELERVPTQTEFTERYGGAISGIMRGRIIPNVRTWNGFLRYMGEEINRDTERWSTPEKITQVYEECKRELKRVPKAREFSKRYGGAFIAIIKGKAIPNVTSWNGFLNYMGEPINRDMERWKTPEKIVQAYEECRQRLGRVPTIKEFTKRYGGAINAITRKKVIPNIRGWPDFVSYMGDKPYLQTRDPISLLESLLEEGERIT